MTLGDLEKRWICIERNEFRRGRISTEVDPNTPIEEDYRKQIYEISTKSFFPWLE
jgi:hypothetical protein